MKAIVYYRVSTASQGEAGNGLNAQRDAVIGWCADKDVAIAGEYIEVESGRKNYRPELLAALAECRDTGAVLVVAKLDRLARNLSFIANLMDSNVKFVALDMPNMDDPDVSRLTIQLLASMAEFESRRISRRTREALAQVKKKKALGSPDPGKGAAAGGAAAKRKAADNANRVMPYIEKLRGYGYDSLRKIADELNAWKVPLRIDKNNNPVLPDLANGPKWAAQQVKNVIDRCEVCAA
jgi:DNA invertase Pin-like site-specific DNA recombinase